MNKPYIICHMACSIDGKIIFDNWGDAVPTKEYSGLYNECHDSFNSQGWILGRVSLEQDFSKGIIPELIAPEAAIRREPFVGDRQATSFAVTLDTKGTLGWEKNEIGGDHIVAVLREDVSDAYLSYLQRMKISYVFAGYSEVDLFLALHRITELFPIDKLMLEGGGLLNGAFLNEGLIDEFSILLLPIADGTHNTSTVFEVGSGLRKNPATLLELSKVEKLPNDVVWLGYKAK